MNNIGKNSFDLGYMDTLASGDSLLHRLDPRAKLIATLVFITAVVSFGKYAVLELLPFFIYPVVLISLGALPAGYLFKKVLLVLPFAVLLGIFNPLIDKEIFYFGPFGIAGGWISFVSIILRSVLTVSAALCLIALTGFNDVGESLAKFGFPRVFVVQLLFFYRYIFVLADETERMVRASAFRSFNSGRIVFNNFIPLVNHLLLHTLDRAERIYCAMRCRLFDGRLRTLKEMHIGYREIIFILGWGILFISLRFFNLSLHLGALVTGY